MGTQNKMGRRLAQKLGASIAAARKARKWAQADLAERLNLATETISRFERGATLPSLVTLQRIAQTLKKPMANLLAEASETPDDQAGIIAAWIAKLREEDRDYVMLLVKTACDHLR